VGSVLSQFALALLVNNINGKIMRVNHELVNFYHGLDVVSKPGVLINFEQIAVFTAAHGRA
jgi:hypothetical protein